MGCNGGFTTLGQTGRLDAKLEEEADIIEDPLQKAASVLHNRLDKGNRWPGKKD
jgi:hypothetical protein